MRRRWTQIGSGHLAVGHPVGMMSFTGLRGAVGGMRQDVRGLYPWMYDTYIEA